MQYELIYLCHHFSGMIEYSRGVYDTEKEAIKKAKKLMNGHDENWKDCFKIVERN